MNIDKIKKFISSFFIETNINSPFTKDLFGKVVVITGGSQGIGKAISRILLREGATIINLSRSMNDTNSSFAIKTDVTSRKEVEVAVHKIINKYGRIDVLINCAGLFSNKEIESTSEDEFDKLIDTNLKGVFLMSKTVIPYMKQRRNGLIINIGSKISHNTNVTPKKVLYATSKYAVEGFSLALSKELMPSGIRVTCLMPGTVNTFVSMRSKQFLAPENIGFLVSVIIKCEDIDFESVIFRSKDQKI